MHALFVLLNVSRCRLCFPFETECRLCFIFKLIAYCVYFQKLIVDFYPAMTSHPEARMVSPNQDPYELPTLKHWRLIHCIHGSTYELLKSS
jgi:hypothetical protein